MKNEFISQDFTLRNLTKVAKEIDSILEKNMEMKLLKDLIIII